MLPLPRRGGAGSGGRNSHFFPFIPSILDSNVCVCKIFKFLKFKILGFDETGDCVGLLAIYLVF